MKKTIVSLAVCWMFGSLLSATNAHAQQSTPQPSASKEVKQEPEKTPSAQQAQQFQQTVVRLKLSQEQEKQMRLIMKQSRNEMKILKEANKDKPKEEKKKILTEQLQKTDAQVNAILTDEQKLIWKQIKQERKAQMKQKREQHQQHKGASEMEDIEGIL